MIYLACPYSHPNPKIRESRCIAANRAAAYLMEQGLVVFSPISMTHAIEPHMLEIRDTEWWMKFDLEFMRHCVECRVLMLLGWDVSPGVAFEMKWFRERLVPVTMMEPV